MLKDYTPTQVIEKVTLCLNQNPCFYSDSHGLWYLESKGNEENDKFYKTLIKKKEPMSLREVTKGTGTKKRKIQKLTEEAALVTDGRFVQMENGNWGLTQWNIEPEIYSLKHLIIKVLKMHPGGVSPEDVYHTVKEWRPCTLDAIKQNLKKFAYFELVDTNMYTYDKKLHAFNDILMERYLGILRRQKQRWQYDRERWKIKLGNLERQLSEVSKAQREAAAALAERVSIMDQYHHLATQLSEKDLLLSMRKKEILRYREQLAKLEAKANSILHQCRLWVNRTKERDMKIHSLQKINEKNQSSLEIMFAKLQQYKEKDRESKAKIAELKDHYTTRIAELQTEIVELKEKLERYKENSDYEERRLYQDINDMSNDLKEALETSEQLQKTVRLLQQELDQAIEAKKKLENKLKPLPVRIALKISSFISGY
ncbi:phage-shock protein [Desulfofalx alkaliphila]|uniref:phage-shock protein n=1 Tax=Desulfofalx alkaliphila TaxID=105483 RepID=UPI001EE3C905|nr:phage-shock protein [Desulfofalx alkaliphila]